MSDAVAAVLAPPALAATSAAAQSSALAAVSAGDAERLQSDQFDADLRRRRSMLLPAGTARCGPSTGAARRTCTTRSPTAGRSTAAGIDGAALIDDSGPAVYFRGSEVFIADGGTTPSAIATVWPQLPPSYRKFGVKGAAWAAGKLVLFRGGTYLTVPWTNGGRRASRAVGHRDRHRRLRRLRRSQRRRDSTTVRRIPATRAAAWGAGDLPRRAAGSRHVTPTAAPTRTAYRPRAPRPRTRRRRGETHRHAHASGESVGGGDDERRHHANHCRRDGHGFLHPVRVRPARPASTDTPTPVSESESDKRTVGDADARQHPRWPRWRPRQWTTSPAR